MKTIEITTPEGYEIDKEKSTFQRIVFKEKIDYEKIKTGSVVMIRDTGCRCGEINHVDLTKPFDVVFFKTLHRIISDGEFRTSPTKYPFYTTFHQDGKYVLFSARRGVDYITKVISY